MKQKYTLFVLLSLIVFGCTNQEWEYVDAGQVQVKANFIKSRVSFNESGDKTYAYWETGDAITLSTPTQGNLNYTATVSEGDATVATFSSEAGSLKDIDGETVYACYPAATITDGVVALPATDTWTDAKPLPFAYAVSSIAESKVDLAFEHVFAFLKLTLPASALENATSTDGDKSVHRILVKSASEDLGILSGTFNFEDKSVNVTGSSKEVVLALRTAFNPSEETGRSVYIPILPQSGDVTMTISLKHAYDGGEDVLLELEKQTPADGFVAGHVYTLTLGGSDEANEPGIYNLEDLIAFRDARNAGGDVSLWKNDEGVINLYADIDMSSVVEWIPISSIEEGEVFNGNSFVISGMNISKTISGEDSQIAVTGIFDKCYGKIANLHLGEGNVNIALTEKMSLAVGSICNVLYGEINTCSNKVNIKITNGTSDNHDDLEIVGGLVGLGYDCKILNSSNYGNVSYTTSASSSSVNVGGIVGGLGDYWTVDNSTIENCQNHGLIEGGYAGGIANMHDPQDGYVGGVTIINCLNKGEIKGFSVAGGIMGEAVGTIKNCINDGNVTSDYTGGFTGFAGGICGWLYAQHTITTIYECTNNGNIVGSNRENAIWTGGIVGLRYRFARLDYGRNVSTGLVNGEASNEENAVGSGDEWETDYFVILE